MHAPTAADLLNHPTVRQTLEDAWMDSRHTDVTRAAPRSGLSSDQILRVARLDAEQAYQDLTPYRISLVLETDGWHVDYLLKDPNLNGGGPHYVIEPVTGA